MVAAAQRVLPNKVFVLVVLLAAAHVDHQRVRLVVKVAAIRFQGLRLRLVEVHLDLGRADGLLDVGVVENAALKQQVHIVLGLVVDQLLEDEQVDHFAQTFALGHGPRLDG